MRNPVALLACVVLAGLVGPAQADEEEGDGVVIHIDGEDDDGDDEAEDEEEEEELVMEEDVFVRRTPAKAWHVAVGPYLWASSVDANVSLGSASVSTGVDFMEIKRHARYGATLLAEARYGRFTIYGDVMYGVVALDGARDVSGFMVTLDGEASSLMADTAAGYRLAGADPQARLSLEARAGLRYQRTAIDGAVNVAGADVSNPSYVDAAADAVVGGQVVARPFRRLTLSGAADMGVYGDSTRTWSAAADATWRFRNRLLVSLGWRTLTTERPNVSIIMHGPRGAVQLMF